MDVHGSGIGAFSVSPHAGDQLFSREALIWVRHQESQQVHLLVAFTARLTLGVTALKDYYVYIMSNVSRTLYVGVTNDLERRVYEHKQKLAQGFTRKYNLTLLVYFEATSDILAAIAREKQIKGRVRAKKVAMIESVNPRWLDLSADWRERGDASLRLSMT